MANKNKKTVSKNYLDFVPVHHEQYEYTIEDSGAVTILVENKGLFNRIAQKCFKKPKISHIHLDEISPGIRRAVLIFVAIVGSKSVYRDT